MVAEAGLDRRAYERPGGLERGVGGGDDALPAPLAACHIRTAKRLRAVYLDRG